MAALPLVIEDEPELESKALSIPEQAERIRVLDQGTYTAACLFLRDTVAAMRREIVDHHKPMKDAAHRAHRAACDAEKRLLEPIERAEQLLKRRIAEYDAEQQRIAEELERLALAEQQRIADEQTEAALEQAEAEGADPEQIRAIIEQPVALARPVIEATHQRVSGVIASKRYKGCVTNRQALLAAVASGKAPQNLVKVDDAVLNALARQYGPELARFVPGTIALAETSISTRSK